MIALVWSGSSTSTVKRRIAPLSTRPAILLLTVASERSSFFARSVLEIRASSRRTLIISWSALSNSPLLFQAHDHFQDAQDFANLRSVYDERRQQPHHLFPGAGEDDAPFEGAQPELMDGY